jgi:iron transport multicopper oxidase
VRAHVASASRPRSAGQYTDGLRTPFVIHPNAANNRTDVTWDEDYTIMVSEWYHEQHEELVDQFMNIYNPTGAEPVPPSAIMYWQQNGQYGTPAADLAKGIDVGDQMSLPFEAGKTYRLRFINAGAFAMFQLQLEGHDWCASPSQSSDWSTRR